MKEKDYKIIDRHLQGELDDEEQQSFKQRLKDDTDFAQAYKMSRQMTNYLQASLKQPALEDKMAELGKLYFKAENKQTAKRIKMPFWRIGLAVAAAISLLILVWNPFNSTNLYEEFASHPPLALVEKSAANNWIEKAEQAYVNKQYQTAYTALSEAIKEQPNNVQAKLALGISALESDRTEEAKAIFKELSKGTSILKTYGQWYLALTYIKQGDNEKAKYLLEKLGNDEPALKKKATELLQKL